MTTSQSLSRGLSRWAHPLCLRGNGFHGSKKKLIFQVNQCDVSGCLVQCLHLPACLPFLLNKTGNVVSDQAFCVRGGGHPPTGANKNPPLTKSSAHSDVPQYVHTSTWLFIYTTDICSVDLCHADIEVYLQSHSEEDDHLFSLVNNRISPVPSCRIGTQLVLVSIGYLCPSCILQQVERLHSLL